MFLSVINNSRQYQRKCRASIVSEITNIRQETECPFQNETHAYCGMIKETNRGYLPYKVGAVVGVCWLISRSMTPPFHYNMGYFTVDYGMSNVAVLNNYIFGFKMFCIHIHITEISEHIYSDSKYINLYSTIVFKTYLGETLSIISCTIFQQLIK